MTSKVASVDRTIWIEDPGRVSDGGRQRDPEVPERARRRTFTAKYKLETLAAYEAAAEGEKGALLRREGLYSSHIDYWRRARDAGALAGLAASRGRKRSCSRNQPGPARRVRRCVAARSALSTPPSLPDTGRRDGPAEEPRARAAPFTDGGRDRERGGRTPPAHSTGAATQSDSPGSVVLAPQAAGRRVADPAGGRVCPAVRFQRSSLSQNPWSVSRRARMGCSEPAPGRDKTLSYDDFVPQGLYGLGPDLLLRARTAGYLKRRVETRIR